MDVENAVVAAGAGKRGRGRAAGFDGYRVSALQDGKVLDTCFTTM